MSFFISFFINCKETFKNIIAGMSIGDMINSVMTLLTAISVILVFLTLLEMKTARDASYLPNIVMNPIEEIAEWDADGDLIWLAENVRPVESVTDNKSDGSISGSIKIPITMFTTPSLQKYSVVNVGAASAVELTFEWDENNSKNLYDCLLSIDSKYKDFFLEGTKSDIFKCKDNLFQMNKEITYSLMYMDSNTDRAYDLLFPAQYSILTGMIMKEYVQGAENLPYIVLNIQFKDIQNKTYNEEIMITITMLKREENEDGSGSVTYQYNPHLLEVKEVKGR